jgi:hypothetical protein
MEGSVARVRQDSSQGPIQEGVVDESSEELGVHDLFVLRSMDPNSYEEV